MRRCRQRRTLRRQTIRSCQNALPGDSRTEGGEGFPRCPTAVPVGRRYLQPRSRSVGSHRTTPKTAHTGRSDCLHEPRFGQATTNAPRPGVLGTRSPVASMRYGMADRPPVGSKPLEWRGRRTHHADEVGVAQFHDCEHGCGWLACTSSGPDYAARWSRRPSSAQFSEDLGPVGHRDEVSALGTAHRPAVGDVGRVECGVVSANDVVLLAVPADHWHPHVGELEPPAKALGDQIVDEILVPATPASRTSAVAASRIPGTANTSGYSTTISSNTPDRSPSSHWQFAAHGVTMRLGVGGDLFAQCDGVGWCVTFGGLTRRADSGHRGDPL